MTPLNHTTRIGRPLYREPIWSMIEQPQPASKLHLVFAVIVILECVPMAVEIFTVKSTRVDINGIHRNQLSPIL